MPSGNYFDIDKQYQITGKIFVSTFVYDDFTPYPPASPPPLPKKINKNKKKTERENIPKLK